MFVLGKNIGNPVLFLLTAIDVYSKAYNKTKWWQKEKKLCHIYHEGSGSCLPVWICRLFSRCIHWEKFLAICIFYFFFGKFLGYFMNVKLIFQKSFIFLPSHCIIKISIFSFDEYPVLILWYIFRTSGVLKLDWNATCKSVEFQRFAET